MSDTVPPRLLGISTYVLARVGRTGRARMAAMLRERGLTLWDLAVLTALDDSPPASQRALARRFAIDPSDLVDVMARLLEAGLIRRDRDPADRRRYLITLTKRGRAELDHATTQAADLDKTLLAPLSPEERTHFTSMLHRLHTHHAERGITP
ncbi:MarR family winged helix-turn-helix transcriptional regulator [Actinomadura rayongensis]|uniref:MarR family transcriptional regulator n=1 Tax=Actinomadura rayongensis TaxID=1429076 RepID=A0A6I4WD06_9ACTN|nr:MarR family winged helix-turn-helix transcriptional regulator [Actinomadura rayongensis]MXQ67013.1 MarR family transcriptional regulator [Actinomadura rayongensis]